MKWKLSLIPLLETACLAVSILLGYFASRSFPIIPSFIFAIPEYHVSLQSLFVIVLVFSISHFLVFLGMAVFLGPNRFDDPARFANEYLAYLFAFTLASLYLYFATTINYDPQMIAAIGILSTLFFFLLYAVVAFRSGRPVTFLSAFGHAAIAVSRAILTPRGVLITLFFLIPPILAVAFVMNRNVANGITRIRIWISDESSGEWALVNALGNVVFNQPMLAKSPPGNDSDLYVLERDGRILRVSMASHATVDTVLDFSEKVGETEFENGALGFAFHPEFGRAESPKRGYLYAYFTDVRNGKQINRLSRFDVSAGAPGHRLGTELELMALGRNASGWHNGGSLEFGPDGYLYVALGEDIRTPQHKGIHEVLREGILRIDVDEQGGGKSHPIARQPVTGKTGNYFIPNDNPFLGDTGIMEEYWALGLRNPYRISFDRQTGDLWAGEVGSTTWEEVNLIEKGGQYQFPYIEGRRPTGHPQPPRLYGSEKGPIYTYEHTAFDRAAIGGIVYRGGKHPSLRGKYVFADNYSSKIFLMDAGKKTQERVDIIAQGPEFAQRGISSVTEAGKGEILVTLLGGRDTHPGKVLKLVRASGLGQAQDAVAGSPAMAPATYSFKEARSIFNVNCARCHGPEGAGNGPDAQALGVALPDFSDPAFQTARTDERIHDIISAGGAQKGLSPLMPAWSHILKEFEVEFLVKYVRELGKIRS